MNGIMSHANGNAPESATVIVTERLLLRAARDTDISMLQSRIFSVPDVMQYVFSGVALPADESETLIRQHFNFGEGKTGLLVLTEKASGDVLGFAGLYPCNVLGGDDFEIGFVLARQAWGQGLSSEIGEAQLALGFRELGCKRLLALTYPENAPSRRAIEKLGMHHIEDVSISGRGPRRVYLISADEWVGRQAE